MSLSPHGVPSPQYLRNPPSTFDARISYPYQTLDANNINIISPQLQTQQFPYHARSSISAMSDTQSPTSGNQHRMSFGSQGAFMHTLKPASIDGSDPTSPASYIGQGVGPGDGTASITSAPNNNSNPTLQSLDEQGKDKGDTLPSWAELKTKAGKERKRLPLACIACRRKKIRCSGEKPACKHCLRSRIPCVYKVTTRKAAPRTDYMAMLDKRLKRMEERVIKIMPKDEQRNVDVIGRAVVKPAIPGLPPKADSKKRVADEAFGEELNSWSKTKSSAKGLSDKVKSQEQKDGLLTEGAESLPSPEIQQHLAEVFFDFVYAQSYHLLHKPSYMRKLEAGQLPPVLVLAVCAISARFSSHPEVRTEPAFLRGEQWAKPAREIALRRYDTPNITILIAYLILGLHEFGTCQGGRSWMLGGMAQRMAYALQLHRDLEPVSPARGQNETNDLSFTDREIRRRTMWACFMMDRFNSSGTDRPLFVAEPYIEAQLPIKEHYFQMEITGPTENLEGTYSKPIEPDTGQVTDPQANMGCAAYIVRAVTVWGQVVRYMNLGGKEKDEHAMWSENSGFKQLKRRVEEYREHLPAELRWNQENLSSHASEKTANQFIFLHIILNQIVLFMNRFALPIPGSRPPFSRDMPPDFLSECARSALESANHISSLVNEGMDHRVVAPFAGYSAFFSSTVHIHGLSSKNPAIEASSKQYLAWNVKYLSKMKKYWGMFHFVTEHLKDLYRRHADSGARLQHAAGSATPSGQKPQDAIFQYGDWFDRYPHGVSGTDYEDPILDIKKEPGSDAVLGQKSDLQSVEEFFAKMSPPSRATQAKKAARKKRTKSSGETQSANQQSAKNAVAQPGEGPPTQQAQHQHIQIPHLEVNQSPSSAFHPDQLSLHQQGQQYSGDMSHDMAMLQAQQQRQQHHLYHQSGIMSNLDRQMVLSSYAGIDPSDSPSNHLHMSHNPHDQFQIDLENYAFNHSTMPGGNMPTNANSAAPAGGGGGWHDNSSAWFMPFNVDPPSGLTDDSGLFGGNTGYDFASLTGMHGFGDLLAPGPGAPCPGPMDHTGASAEDGTREGEQR